VNDGTIVAIDLSNRLKTGDTLELKVELEFDFEKGKIKG